MGILKVKIVLAAVMIVVLAFFLSACGWFAPPPEPTPTPRPTPAPTPVPTPTPTPAEDIEPEEEEEPEPEETLPMPGERGNTTGNISNVGMAVLYEDRIFFSNAHDDYFIHYIYIDGDDEWTRLNENPAIFLNIVNERVFYINFDSRAIYSMDLDAGDLRRLSDDAAWWLNVVGNRIYFVNLDDDNTIHSMNLDGSDQQRLGNDYAMQLIVYDNSIFYSNMGMGEVGFMYSMNLDGSDRRRLNEDAFSGIINIQEDRIFYIALIDVGWALCSMNFDGTDQHMHMTFTHDEDRPPNFNFNRVNISDGRAVYTNAPSGNVYAINLDGSDFITLPLPDGPPYINDINIVGDWIFITRWNPDEGPGSISQQSITGGWR